MGHKHTKAEILDGALAVALDESLSQLSFGRVAKRMGISDRIVVYYFPSKDDLIGEVLFSMGAQLQATLAPTMTKPAASYLDLVATAWPILATPPADPVFSLFFEASGLSARGIEPYRTLVPQLMQVWIDWTSEFVRGTPKQRRIEAEAAVATLDGLLLLRRLAGPDAANRAARRLLKAAVPVAR